MGAGSGVGGGVGSVWLLDWFFSKALLTREDCFVCAKLSVHQGTSVGL